MNYLMMKRLLMLSVSVILFIPTIFSQVRHSTAGFYTLPASPRQVFNFNPGWSFHKGDIRGAEHPGFDDSDWERASLPHGLEILGENASGMRNYQGPAWYRKRFQTPDRTAGLTYIIYFEGVMGKAEVWLNGVPVGTHHGGYLPFAVDVSDQLINHDGDHVIAIRADNSNDESYPPGKPQDNLDFTYLGGIYRDVFLIQTSDVYVSLPEVSKTIAGGGVFVGVKDVDGKDADIEVRTEVINRREKPVNIQLRTALERTDGTEVTTKLTNARLMPGASRNFQQEMAVNDVHLWHPDDPYLHFIRTEVLIDGIVVDSYRTRFGIRLFEMRGDDGFFVNKQYIGHKLSGVNRHQDYAYIGNALPNSGQWRDVKLLREGGSNIVRAAHYPLDPAFMDACDEFGMLVTVANPGWQFYNDNDPLFDQRLADDTRQLVRRDRNRPAVLLWETAINETPWQPASVMQNLHRIVHEEFPFPGAFTAADVDEAKNAGFDFYYHGGMEEEKCSLTREYGDGGEVDNFYSQNAMSRVKRDWGELPMLNQARIRAEGLNGIYNTPPKRIGATLWCGIDHQRGYHPDPFWGGLLDGFRMPRYSYYLFKSQYDANFKLNGISTGPMVFIAHEVSQVSGRDITVFSNCEEIRLTWLGNVVGTQRPDSMLRNMPHPPVVFKDVFDFHEITANWRNRTAEIKLVAEGLIGGEVVVREEKLYAERTTGIKLEIDSVGASLTADGSDFVPVRATIVDNKGIAKPLASAYIHFTVEGPASIIGGSFNNANPAKTEFGTATMLLRASTQPGRIVIRAYAEGLVPDSISLESISSPLPLWFDPSEADRPSVSTTATSTPAIMPRESTSAGQKTLGELEDRIKRLELEITSRDQDIMELRSRLKQ